MSNFERNILNEDPLVFTISNFVSADDCEHFIKISKPNLKEKLEPFHKLLKTWFFLPELAPLLRGDRSAALLPRPFQWTVPGAEDAAAVAELTREFLDAPVAAALRAFGDPRSVAAGGGVAGEGGGGDPPSKVWMCNRLLCLVDTI